MVRKGRCRVERNPLELGSLGGIGSEWRRVRVSTNEDLFDQQTYNLLALFDVQVASSSCTRKAMRRHPKSIRPRSQAAAGQLSVGVMQDGEIVAVAELGGLHHRYERIEA
jgi:hypothetical protein